MTATHVDVDDAADLVQRYDRAGPRYTSYPSADRFNEDVDASEYERRLAGAAQRPDEPLSAYLHLPFCEERCSFCGCHTFETNKPRIAHDYLERIGAEIALVAERLGGRRQVSQYHWGGGTPTFFDTEALRGLHSAFVRSFDITPDAECAVEIDPRVTSVGHLEVMRELGFNRISLGLQDVDADVQEAIGRVQSPFATANLLNEARRLGYESVNVDLIYGLPKQTPATFRATLDDVVQWRPDRLAVYGFAYVPWRRPVQKRLDASRLPDARSRYELFALAEQVLTDAGYVSIGMDHFALPDDELVRARADGTLARTFMGYTVDRAPDILGFGTSAIGDVDGAYVQNTLRLQHYFEAMDSGRLATERGMVRSADDEIRRFVITQLMCNLGVRWADVGTAFGIDPLDYFAGELAALDADPATRELVEIDREGVVLSDLGTRFSRNVAMAFDAYLTQTEMTEPRYSRTV